MVYINKKKIKDKEILKIKGILSISSYVYKPLLPQCCETVRSKLWMTRHKQPSTKLNSLGPQWVQVEEEHRKPKHIKRLVFILFSSHKYCTFRHKSELVGWKTNEQTKNLDTKTYLTLHFIPFNLILLGEALQNTQTLILFCFPL